MADIQSQPKYVGYPRSRIPGLHGTADQLEALGKAFGLQNVSLIPLIGSVSSILRYPLASQSPEIVALIVFAGSFNGLVAYMRLRRVGFAIGLTKGTEVAFSILFGLVLPLWDFIWPSWGWAFAGYVCTLAAFFVALDLAVTCELNRYMPGFKKPFWKIDRETLKAEVARRKELESIAPPPPPIPDNLYSGSGPAPLG